MEFKDGGAEWPEMRVDGVQTKPEALVECVFYAKNNAKLFRQFWGEEMIGSDVRCGLGVIKMILLRRRNRVNFINKSWQPATHYFVDIHKMNVEWVKVAEETPLCCPFTFLRVF